MELFDALFAKKYGINIGGSVYDELLGEYTAKLAPPTPTMPSKGDVIAVDMNGDGTAENYLVLKVNGSVAEVLARANLGEESVFGAYNTYANSTLDTLLNNSYYSTLSNIAKSAIIDKTFKQDSWYYGTSGNPSYNGLYGASNKAYQVSLGSGAFGNEITRHIYAISVQDVIDYLGVTTEMTSADTTLNMLSIQAMVDDADNNDFWLSSANAGGADKAMSIACFNGFIYFRGVATTNTKVRPAFQLDLTKIEWSPVTA